MTTPIILHTCGEDGRRRRLLLPGDRLVVEERLADDDGGPWRCSVSLIGDPADTPAIGVLESFDQILALLGGEPVQLDPEKVEAVEEPEDSGVCGAEHAGLSCWREPHPGDPLHRSRTGIEWGR